MSKDEHAIELKWSREVCAATRNAFSADLTANEAANRIADRARDDDLWRVP